MGDKTFKKAKQLLIQISDDPNSRELARLREKARIDYERSTASNRERRITSIIDAPLSPPHTHPSRLPHRLPQP